MQKAKYCLVAALVALGSAALAQAGDGVAPAAAPPAPRLPLMGATTTSDVRLVPVSAHCFAVVSTAGQSNAGVVIGRDKVLIIDTLGAPARTEKLLAEIAAITSKPLAALVLTHWHYDHVVGDQRLPKDVPIYCDSRSHKRLAERLQADRLLLGPGSGSHGSIGIAEVREPDHDVDGETHIDLGDLVVTLATVSAKNATHSCGDMIAWIASDRVLYTGDLVVNGYLPHLADSETFAWIDVLARLRGIPAERVVPGHGAVGGPELVALQLDYFMTLRRYVKHMARERIGEDDAAKSLLIPEKFAKLGCAEWWPDNVRFVYRELIAGK